jgi:hypothetical protein
MTARTPGPQSALPAASRPLAARSAQTSATAVTCNDPSRTPPPPPSSAVADHHTLGSTAEPSRQPHTPDHPGIAQLTARDHKHLRAVDPVGGPSAVQRNLPGECLGRHWQAVVRRRPSRLADSAEQVGHACRDRQPLPPAADEAAPLRPKGCSPPQAARWGSRSRKPLSRSSSLNCRSSLASKSVIKRKRPTAYGRPLSRSP